MKLNEAITFQHKHLDESVTMTALAAGGAAIVTVSGAYAKIKQIRRQAERDEMMQKLAREYDAGDILTGNTLIGMVDKYDNANTIKDVDKIESEVNEVLGNLTKILNRIDNFVEKEYRTRKTVGDRILFNNLEKEKQRLKDRFIVGMATAFVQVHNAKIEEIADRLNRQTENRRQK